MRLVVATALCLSLLAAAAGAEPAPEGVVRLAQFNIWELSRAKLDSVDAAGRGSDPQLVKAAAILQRLRPDVVLLNEIDYDDAGTNARLFVERYLAVAQPQGGAPLDYPHVFMAPVNTGVPSGLDLDHDGASDGPADAYGFGRYPGQYGMALLSRFPIEADAARSFRLLRWTDVPGHVMPDGGDGRPAHYAPEAVAVFRLSSKSHWDVPVRLGGVRLHVLAAHPTPGGFDGPEDANGRRNFDEIRLLADYVRGGAGAAYIVDDAGVRGALAAGAPFVVMGDMNADRERDAAPYGSAAIDQLLVLPRVQDPRPTSEGARLAPVEGYDAAHPQRRTGRWGRIDYVLPSTDLRVVDSGVFWPVPGAPGRELVAPPDPASDHRLVWVDLALPLSSP